MSFKTYAGLLVLMLVGLVAGTEYATNWIDIKPADSGAVAPAEGRMFWNTSSQQVNVYDGNLQPVGLDGRLACDYLVYTNGSRTYVKSCDSGMLLKNTTNATEAIEYALSMLTPNRTWKETVYLHGNFTVDRIDVPSYTVIRIDGRLRLRDWANDTVIRINTGAQYVDIVGGIIDGNKANQVDTGVDGKQVCIYGSALNFWSIRDVTCVASKREGIYISTSGWGHISNIMIRDTGLTGLEVDSIQYSDAINVRVLNAGLHGVDLVGGATRTHKEFSLIGGQVYGAAGYGIRVFNADGFKIVGTKVRDNGDLSPYHHGIFVTNSENIDIIGVESWENNESGIYVYNSEKVSIIGGSYHDNGQSGAGLRYGVTIYNSNSSVVTGARIYTNATATQSYAFRVYGGSENVTIYGNIIDVNLPFFEVTPGTKVYGNSGVVTENSGVTAVSNSDSVLIPHGLAGAPDVVTFSVNTSAVQPCWIAGKDSSNINITCSSAGTFDIYWYAEYKP